MNKMKQNIVSILLLLLCFAFCNSLMSSCKVNVKLTNINNKDTTIVGKLLNTDSIYTIINSTYIGVKYYYGVHHLKIGVINISTNQISDTLIIAYVYNMINEHSLYLKNFNLSIGRNYIFHVHRFVPCKSDFPKIQGWCDEDDYFEPESNKLIHRYKDIYRVIYAVDYER
jgi:hypothetical protein